MTASGVAGKHSAGIPAVSIAMLVGDEVIHLSLKETWIWKFNFQILAMADLQNGGHFLKQSHNNHSKTSVPSTPSKAVNCTTNPDGEKKREK